MSAAIAFVVIGAGLVLGALALFDVRLALIALGVGLMYAGLDLYQIDE